MKDRFARAERDRRRTRRLALQQRGIKAARCLKAYCIEPSAIPVPDWALRLALKGLSVSADHVWLKRTDAWLLRLQDREAGGEPKTTEAEYRVCQICGRALLAEDAEERRKLNDSAVTGWMKPCDSECYAIRRKG